MALALSAASTAFAPTPLAHRAPAHASAVRMGVDDMIGKYSVKGTVFDPLGLADKCAGSASPCAVGWGWRACWAWASP